MTKPPEIKDANKKKLIEHLLSTVVAGVTGRDNADLVNVEPKRAIFSGVLFPLTETDEKQLTGSGGKSEAPPRTAIGFEFKVRPATGASALKLVIKPSWAQYYPIFPNWDDVLRSRRSEVETSLSKPDAAAQAAAAEPTAASVKPAPVDILTLPLKFRSVRPVVDAISVSIPVGAPSSIAIGEEQLRAAIAAGQNKAVSDSEIWRHLGEPKQAERRIRGSGLLATKASYEQALAKISGPKVSLPDWKLTLRIFVSLDSGELRIRVLLANTTKEGQRKSTDSKLEEAALFDANLEVKVDGGAITPFEFLLAPSDYRSRRDLFAKGTNCSTLCALQPEQKIATDTIPVFWQPLSKTKEPFALTFDTLTDDNAFSVLQQLAAHMGSYESDWQKYLSIEAVTKLTPEELSECEKDKKTFHEEISRLELGIECLKKDPLLFEAFKLMNQAFEELGKRSGGRLSKWRLFQLGFIVSQLPALAIRNISATQSDEYAKKLRQLHSEVGILWFPTGGGKTEAYLGLIAVAMLFDRLRGKERGVCTWMRFPLRMLSLQQLERLAKVVAVLNEFRAKNSSLKGDCFSIGYFVGGSETTPNSVSGELMTQYEQDDTLRNKMRLMRRCPHCDSEILIKVIRKNWRVAHVCSNANCFSNTSASLGIHKGTLPVFVVDSEIYRYLPTVLVGTVDKLATIGFQPFFAHIVRGANQQCEDHGYASYDKCIEHYNGCKATKRKLKTLSPIIDPGPSLLVQDELHLLREELGVFNGHYESLLAHLGDQIFLRPKVLAATATIEAYEIQAFHIYLNTARRFPSPGWLFGESFYSSTHPTLSRRCYVGILNNGRSVEDLGIRIFELYQRAVRQLQKDTHEARTVMGCGTASDDEIQQVLRLYDFSVFYVNKKAVGGNLIDRLGAVEQAFGLDALGTVGRDLLTGDQGFDYVGEVLERIEKERSDTGKTRLNALAATSLISHGVDLDRINMMVIAGMPSHYAEYVQSSSRTARSNPGFAFVCFGAKDPRETSQYELFQPMHQHLDRLIEPVAINRFAVNAPEKTIPGILTALLLCEITPQLYGKDIAKMLNDTATLKAALGLAAAPQAGTRVGCVDKEELRKAILNIIGVNVSSSYVTKEELLNLSKRINDVYDELLGAIGRELKSKLGDILHPISSLRDVDEMIEFSSNDSSGLVTKLRAGGKYGE